MSLFRTIKNELCTRREIGTDTNYLEMPLEITLVDPTDHGKSIHDLATVLLGQKSRVNDGILTCFIVKRTVSFDENAFVDNIIVDYTFATEHDLLCGGCVAIYCPYSDYTVEQIDIYCEEIIDVSTPDTNTNDRKVKGEMYIFKESATGSICIICYDGSMKNYIKITYDYDTDSKYKKTNIDTFDTSNTLDGTVICIVDVSGTLPLIVEDIEDILASGGNFNDASDFVARGLDYLKKQIDDIVGNYTKNPAMYSDEYYKLIYLINQLPRPGCPCIESIPISEGRYNNLYEPLDSGIELTLETPASEAFFIEKYLFEKVKTLLPTINDRPEFLQYLTCMYFPTEGMKKSNKYDKFIAKYISLPTDKDILRNLPSDTSGETNEVKMHPIPKDDYHEPLIHLDPTSISLNPADATFRVVLDSNGDIIPLIEGHTSKIEELQETNWHLPYMEFKQSEIDSKAAALFTIEQAQYNKLEIGIRCLVEEHYTKTRMNNLKEPKTNNPEELFIVSIKKCTNPSVEINEIYTTTNMSKIGTSSSTKQPYEISISEYDTGMPLTVFEAGKTVKHATHKLINDNNVINSSFYFHVPRFMKYKYLHTFTFHGIRNHFDTLRKVLAGRDEDKYVVILVCEETHKLDHEHSYIVFDISRHSAYAGIINWEKIDPTKIIEDQWGLELNISIKKELFEIDETA